MSQNNNRMVAFVALEIAGTIKGILSAGCERIGIAGSLRRRKQSVGDIEFLMVPKVERGPGNGQLFATEASKPIYKIVDQLVETSRFEYGHASAGDRYRKIIYGKGTAQEIGIDLNFVEADQWGNMFALKTGPADFSRLLVTTQDGANPDAGGALPVGWKHQGCYLWNERGEKVVCREEVDFFSALGLPHWLPIDRSASTLRDYLRRAVYVGT